MLGEDQKGLSDLREAFEAAISKKHVGKSYARNFGKGLFQVVKVPWKLTNVMMLSLEKVVLNWVLCWCRLETGSKLPLILFLGRSTTRASANSLPMSRPDSRKALDQCSLICSRQLLA